MSSHVPAHTTTEAATRPFLPIRRILCPVDFSEWSREAVDRAVDLARPTHAEITGLFVLSCVTASAGEGRSTSCTEDADESMISAVAEDLEEFFDPVRKAGLTLHVFVKRGDCVARILEQARETEADVVVMGTHGRTGLERWVLGSVTDGVVREASCPVLAVPRLPAGSRSPGPVDGRILCAVGLSERSERTLSYALGLGRSTGATVTVVHVSDAAGSPSVSATCRNKLARKLHAAVLTSGPQPRPCAEMVLTGQAHREILRLAEAQPSGLIVMGTQDRGLGATASRVVREAKAPVLIVPSAPDGRQS